MLISIFNEINDSSCNALNMSALSFFFRKKLNMKNMNLNYCNTCNLICSITKRNGICNISGVQKQTILLHKFIINVLFEQKLSVFLFSPTSAKVLVFQIIAKEILDFHSMNMYSVLAIDTIVWF